MFEIIILTLLKKISIFLGSVNLIDRGKNITCLLNDITSKYKIKLCQNKNIWQLYIYIYI